VVFSNAEMVKRVLTECGEEVVYNDQEHVWYRVRNQLNNGPALMRIATIHDNRSSISVSTQRQKQQQQQRRRRREEELPPRRLRGEKRLRTTASIVPDERQQFELDMQLLKAEKSERIELRKQRFARLQSTPTTTTTTTPTPTTPATTVPNSTSTSSTSLTSTSTN
jgi:hypothetical protein